MAEKPNVKKPEQQKRTPIVYTQEEVEYRDDLQGKLLTLEHVKSILISRDDSPVFLHHINDLHQMVRSWFLQTVTAKNEGSNEPKGTPEKGSDEGSGDEPDT